MVKLEKLFEDWKHFVKEKKTKGAATIILDDNDRFLLLKRADDDYWMPSKWGLPGGKIDPGEGSQEAAVREAKEETNLDVRNLRFIIETNGAHYFTTRDFSGQVQISHEHTAFAWVSIEEIDKYDVVNIAPYNLKDIIQGVFDGE